MIWALLLGCAHQAPPVVWSRDQVASALHAAAVLVELPAPPSRPACAVTSVAAATLRASAEVIAADVPVLPELRVDLSRCQLLTVDVPAGTVEAVTAAIDLTRAGLVLGGVSERQPREAAAADAALAYARDLVPAVLAAVAGDELVFVVPGRAL